MNIDLTNKSSIEIDAVLDELELKLSGEQEAQTEIQQARINKRKEIAQLRLEILELDGACEKADFVIRQTKIDIKRTESKKFQALRTERFTT